MKKLLTLCFCIILSQYGFSQITYLVDTAFTTDIGFNGAPASCRAPHMQYFGWQMGRQQDSWVADAFTVPVGATWKFDTVIVYGYQFGSGTTSTLMNCNLQIYSGTPGLGGTVIWGDTSTNVLSSSGWTGIYRVDTVTADGGLMSTNRPIMYMKLFLSPAPSLSAGTYWLSWSAAGASSNIPDAPDKVLPGRVNPSGQKARQLFGGTWYYIVDSNKNIGMDKIIKASANVGVGVANLNKPTFASLDQNAPNPFTGSTEISFYMPEAGPAQLTVYNAIGQLVTTLVDGNVNSGNQHVVFNAGDLPNGIYYYKLSTTTVNISRQMVLMR